MEDRFFLFQICLRSAHANPFQFIVLMAIIVWKTGAQPLYTYPDLDPAQNLDADPDPGSSKTRLGYSLLLGNF
jgi:hypothetical protein